MSPNEKRTTTTALGELGSGNVFADLGLPDPEQELLTAMLATDPDAEMSPDQAAKMLGISRPMVNQRMDGGHLPFREVGAYRHVLVADVIKLKEFEDRRRAPASFLSSADPLPREQVRRGNGSISGSKSGEAMRPLAVTER